ncbi:tRNA splicing endonuclease subunit sen2 [Actinomortierella ambigua]|nr:tRNA splicing endonuclease subunit sen2 [Actinomortierella ambigua]
MLTSSSVSLSNLDIDSFEDMEHLQLSLEEAFFLVFAIEAIAVYTSLSTSSDKGADPPMTIRECWSRFAMASSAKDRHIAFKDSVPCGWENPFTIRYVAYHHFRSHGWVVKDGLKYGVDFLLYRKGVVFGHSEYAVKVVQGSPGSTAEESHSLSSPPLLLSPRPILGKVDPWHHPVYSWQYLLNISRVVSQVQKTLLLCHVIPPQDSSSLPDHILLDPRLALPQYTVVEVTSRRWIPERHRA